MEYQPVDGYLLESDATLDNPLWNHVVDDHDTQFCGGRLVIHGKYGGDVRLLIPFSAKTAYLFHEVSTVPLPADITDRHADYLLRRGCVAGLLEFRSPKLRVYG